MQLLFNTLSTKRKKEKKKKISGSGVEAEEKDGGRKCPCPNLFFFLELRQISPHRIGILSIGVVLGLYLTYPANTKQQNTTQLNVPKHLLHVPCQLTVEEVCN